MSIRLRLFTRALFLLLSSEVIADSGEIILYPGEEPTHIMRSMILVDGTGRDLSSTQVRRDLSAQFSVLPKVAPPRFAPVESNQWLVGKLVNVSEQHLTYILDTDEVVRYGVEVWLLQLRGESLIFQTTRPPRPLANRLVPEPLLRSTAIELAPGERAYLWVHHDARFSAKESFDLLAPSTLSQRREARGMRFGLLAGAQASLVLFFAVFAALLRFWPAFFYSLLFATLLISDFHYEGILFANLYPQTSEWLSVLNPLIALASSFAFVFFLYSILSIRRNQWVMHTLAVLALGIPAFSVLRFSTETLNVTQAPEYAPTVALFSCFFLACIVHAIRERIAGAYILAFGILLFVSRYALRGLAELAVVDVSTQMARQIIPVIQLADGLLFAALVVQRARALRHERDKAKAAQMQALEQQVELAAQHARAERERDEQRHRAEMSRQRLTVASHDLRQPLASLRVSLEDVRAVAPDAGQAIQASVDYLDGILGSSLRTTLLEQGEAEVNPASLEEVAVQTLFDNVQRMFASEAETLGVRLHCVPTSAVVVAEPIALIRMLSNLVSNAVKYVGKGRVLVGVRRQAGRYSIEVWDNGHGLSAAQLERVLKPYERGDGGQGEGLGLDIVSQLAESSGLSFTAQSWLGEGSVFRIGDLEPKTR